MEEKLPSNEYFAGLFDGEGWFRIARYKIYSTRFTYQATVGLALRQEEVVGLLKAAFGGTVTAGKPRSEKHNISYRWQASGNNALAFALAVKPFLRIKERQADIVIEFQTNRGASGPPLSGEAYDRYESLYQNMKSLNKRGT